jgi:membrane protease YdiL (CAAX protease family)
MMWIFTGLAEISIQSGLFWEYRNPPPGAIAAGVLFLLLLCAGVAVDIGMIVQHVKRPVSRGRMAGFLADRSLPGMMLLSIFSIVIFFYLAASYIYSRFFMVAEIDPGTVVFQTIAFHFPVLALTALLFFLFRINMGEFFGLRGIKPLRMLGTAGLFYLAALPPIWLLSIIYQLLLTRLGVDLSLQDVTAVLAMPASWPVRAAMFLIAIVIAPLFEEILFRGILLPFAVRRTGFWPGILLISLIFGGLHLHLPTFAPLFLLSMMLCLAYARTRSLLVSIGMHAAFNGVTVLILLLMG